MNERQSNLLHNRRVEFPFALFYATFMTYAACENASNGAFMIMPPYKTKMVEPIRILTKQERTAKIRRAGYNLFFLKSEDVTIDLLTDSGTGAMSEHQWAGLMEGDESYAGSTSFFRLKKAVADILGFRLVIPTHQGRGAEAAFNKAVLKKGDIVTGNSPFDTTRAHIEHVGATIVDATCKEAFSFKNTSAFKGNVDIKKLERTLKQCGDTVAYVLLTMTCNSMGGQPISLANIKDVARLCTAYKRPLYYDIARFAENAFFIQEREKKYRTWSVHAIVREMMKHADGALMSAKKDAIVNMGGFIALRSAELYGRISPYSILNEGFLHYGGMSGRDMEALAVGLHEGTEEKYLRHRVGQTAYLAESLHRMNVPVIRPAGGHAVYVNAGLMLPHIPWNNFPAQALAIAVYIEGGIRGVEIGSIMEGRDPNTRESRRAHTELLRLAIPRRVYSQEHLDHVIETFRAVAHHKKRISGVRFRHEAPILRHFSSTFRLA